MARDAATESILDRLARAAVGRYALPPDARATLVNLSENATQAMGVAYTEATIPLGQHYLSRFASRRAA